MKKFFLGLLICAFTFVSGRSNAVTAGLATPISIGFLLAGTATGAGVVLLAMDADHRSWKDPLWWLEGLGIMVLAVSTMAFDQSNDQSFAQQMQNLDPAEDLAQKVRLGIYTEQEAQNILKEVNDVVVGLKTKPIFVKTEGLSKEQIQASLSSQVGKSPATGAYLTSILLGLQI